MTTAVQKIDATVENFMTAVVEASNTTPVLVDFWAPWCAPCRTLMPLLDRIADDYAGRFILAKVNTEEQARLASHFQIRSIPTVMLVHRGEVVEQFTGLQPEAAIKALLDRHVPPAGTAAERPRLRSRLSLRCPRDPSTSPRSVSTAAMPRQRPPPSTTWLPPSRSTPPCRRCGHDWRSCRWPTPIPMSVALRSVLEQNPADPAARHALAAHHAAAGDYGTALAEWLDLMRRNRSFGEDAGRRSLLQVFDVLGEQDALVAQYRRRMASLLH